MHAVHVVWLPAAKYDPALHLVHPVSLVAVHGAVMYDPVGHTAEHAVHACWPPTALYVPALHARHAASVVGVALADSNWPTPHTVVAVHEKLPTADLYVWGVSHIEHARTPVVSGS